MTEYLGVKETAERLGVHPNTVRNWARDGLLTDRRIEGTRFHRFDAEEIAALDQARVTKLVSEATIAGRVGRERVDASMEGLNDAQIAGVIEVLSKHLAAFVRELQRRHGGR